MRANPAQQADVEQAIARILQAEREADEAVARCKVECAERAAASRERARKIQARAERRIAALRGKFSVPVSERIRDLDGAVAQPPREAARELASDELLSRAAGAVARELTGAEK
jgi:vacuolar-type H+-ATPase subunit H